VTPGRIVVIGAADEVELYALAGARVIVAADSGSVRTAWSSLPAETGLVVLTAQAAAFVQLESGACDRPLVAVIGG
jgi:vacuolar-type H+-ATPase subunit F/Vma7